MNVKKYVLILQISRFLTPMTPELLNLQQSIYFLYSSQFSPPLSSPHLSAPTDVLTRFDALFPEHNQNASDSHFLSPPINVQKPPEKEDTPILGSISSQINKEQNSSSSVPASMPPTSQKNIAQTSSSSVPASIPPPLQTICNDYNWDSRDYRMMTRQFDTSRDLKTQKTLNTVRRNSRLRTRRIRPTRNEVSITTYLKSLPFSLSVSLNVRLVNAF